MRLICPQQDEVKCESQRILPLQSRIGGFASANGTSQACGKQAKLGGMGFTSSSMVVQVNTVTILLSLFTLHHIPYLLGSWY